MKIKSKYILISVVFFLGYSCIEDYDTPTPTLESFGVYELVNNNGILEAGSEVTNPVAGTTYRLQAFTQSDIATFWPGDFTYRPLGANDSIIDSRNYFLHYGQPGAQGLTTNSIAGRRGWFQDYAWPDSATYDVAIILTNHSPDDENFVQVVFDRQITVSE